MTPEDRERISIRLSLIDGMLDALSRWPQIAACVWETEDRRAAHSRLCVDFGYSEMVANYVLDMQVVRATAAARDELADEATQYRVQLGAGTASPEE